MIKEGKTYPVPVHKTWDINDASKLSEHRRCRRKFFFRYVLGWDTEEPNIHLVHGEGWHRAMSHVLRHGFSPEEVTKAYNLYYEYYREYFSELQDELNYPKSPGSVLQSLEEYSVKYGNEDFELLHTEIAGTVPVDDNRVLHFRLDTICRDKDGYFCLEHKTTSMLSQAWLDSWSLSLQVWLYTHVLYCLFPPDDVWGIKINGAVFRKKGNEYPRVLIRKTPDMMAVGHWNVLNTLDLLEWDYDELAESSKEDEVMETFPMNDTACFSFGKLCAYHAYCTAWKNPLQRCDEPPTGLVVKRWNPADLEDDAKAVVTIGGEGESVLTEKDSALNQTEPLKDEFTVKSEENTYEGIGTEVSDDS